MWISQVMNFLIFNKAMWVCCLDKLFMFYFKQDDLQFQNYNHFRTPIINIWRTDIFYKPNFSRVDFLFLWQFFSLFLFQIDACHNEESIMTNYTSIEKLAVLKPQSNDYILYFDTSSIDQNSSCASNDIDFDYNISNAHGNFFSDSELIQNSSE